MCVGVAVLDSSNPHALYASHTFSFMGVGRVCVLLWKGTLIFSNIVMYGLRKTKGRGGSSLVLAKGCTNDEDHQHHHPLFAKQLQQLKQHRPRKETLPWDRRWAAPSLPATAAVPDGGGSGPVSWGLSPPECLKAQWGRLGSAFCYTGRRSEPQVFAFSFFPHLQVT